jgi:hypothetical protein
MPCSYALRGQPFRSPSSGFSLSNSKPLMWQWPAPLFRASAMIWDIIKIAISIKAWPQFRSRERALFSAGYVGAGYACAISASGVRWKSVQTCADDYDAPTAVSRHC